MSGTVGGVAYTAQETYDHFGNRNVETVTAGSNQVQPSNYLHFSAGNNRADEEIYDNAGNPVSDGTNNYLYDAENRICAVQQAATGSGGGLIGYLYAPDGTRLGKNANLTSFSCDMTKNGMLTSNGLALTSLYTVGPQGEQLEETDGSSNLIHFNVFWEGKVLGSYSGATYAQTNWHFALNDWVGNKRVITNSDGGYSTSFFSGPFGDFQTQSGSGSDPSEHHFAAKERDTESNLDYFPARYYNSNVGRWMSPDWSSDPDPVPYADFTNPQSLNLYGYVDNNPLSYFDPTGHDNQGCNASVADTLGNGDILTVTVNCPQLPTQTFNLMQTPNYTSVPTLESGLKTGPLPLVLPQITGPEVPQVGPATNNPKQDYCLRQALKGAAKDITGLSLIGDVAEALTSASFSPLLSPGYGVDVAEHGADFVAGSMAAKTAIRAALREEAVKVSTKAVGKAATVTGKFASGIGVGITAKSAYDAYKQCMAQ
jgi:RHS repeat-associated protein